MSVIAITRRRNPQLSTIFRLSLAEQLQSAVMLDDQLTQSDAQRMAWLAMLNSIIDRWGAADECATAAGSRAAFTLPRNTPGCCGPLLRRRCKAVAILSPQNERDVQIRRKVLPQ